MGQPGPWIVFAALLVWVQVWAGTVQVQVHAGAGVGVGVSVGAGAGVSAGCGGVQMR